MVTRSGVPVFDDEIKTRSERLLFMKEEELGKIPSIGKVALEQIDRYRARFLGTTNASDPPTMKVVVKPSGEPPSEPPMDQ